MALAGTKSPATLRAESLTLLGGKAIADLGVMEVWW